MSGLLEFIFQLLLVVGAVSIAGWAVNEWIRGEVSDQIDQKLELEINRMRATREIRDELRRSSREMINASLEAPVIDDQRYGGPE